MRKTLIFLLSSFLTCTINGQNNDASIDETIDFIKTKIEKTEATLSCKVSFDKTKCELVVTDTETGSIPYISTDYIPLSKIDPSGVYIWEPKDADYIILHFDMIGKANSVRRTVIEKWDGGTTKNVTDNHIQWIFDSYSKQNNIPERVKTALLHAIKLCGGKSEKF